MALVASIKDFGRFVGTGNDDTAAWIAALAAQAGGKLLVPAGTYQVSAALAAASGSALEIVGDGLGVTTITTNQAAGDVLTLPGAFQSISGIRFTASVQRTAGAFLNLTGSRIEMSRLRFDQYFKGVSVSGVGTLEVDKCMWLGTTFAGADSAMDITGAPNDMSMTRCLMDGPAGTMPLAGIRVAQCGDINMSDLNIIHHGSDLLVVPGAGQVIASLNATNCYFDTATRGIAILPTSTGTVVRCRFVQCWFSSHTSQGIYIVGGGSTNINGVDFVDPHVFLNGSNGAELNAASNVRVIGGKFAQNTGAGIKFLSSGGFCVIGARCGNADGLSGNTTYGIDLASTTTDLFSLIGNDCRGNTSGGINNASTVASPSQLIIGNLPRIGTGWAAWTGTPTRTTKVTSTATLANVAEALKALTDDLIAQGIIGS